MRQPRLHALERRVTRAIGALPLWLQHQMRDSGHVAALLNSLTLAATALIGNIRLLRSRRAARLEIAYGPLPAHRLDIYGEVASRHPTAPAIVFIHGGGWTLGSKLLYGLVGDSLACHGAVCSVVGYRLFPEAAIPEQVDDVRLALQSLHERFPKRPLVLVGHSSGAHVAALTMACAAASGEPLPIRGFCGISGVYDVASHFEHERQRDGQTLVGSVDRDRKLQHREEDEEEHRHRDVDHVIRRSPPHARDEPHRREEPRPAPKHEG